MSTRQSDPLREPKATVRITHRPAEKSSHINSQLSSLSNSVAKMHLFMQQQQDRVPSEQDFDRHACRRTNSLLAELEQQQ